MGDRDTAALEGFLRFYQGALDDVTVQTVAAADGVHTLNLGVLRRLRDQIAAAETAIKRLGEENQQQQYVAELELEAEFTGRLEWTIGATDDDGETYYGGSYTENGARFHAARRQGGAFPAYRRETVFHRVDNTEEEEEFAALRAAADKEPQETEQ